MKKSIYAIIPARGGSKGIPGKNISDLGGKPLIKWTIDAAAGARSIDGFLVSTDSEDIANAARGMGANVPFIRPPDIAGDTSPVIDAILHALDFLARDGIAPDAVMLLQPTAPFRTSEDIDGAVSLYLSDYAADSLISVAPVSHAHPSIMYTMSDDRVAPLLDSGATPRRRQDFDDVFIRNGAIYITSVELLKQRKIIGERPLAYVMPRERSVNIDDPLDLALARALAAETGG